MSDRCMAETSRGGRCQLQGVEREGGWVGCGFHPAPAPRPDPTRARELLEQALAHRGWLGAPGEIRVLVEAAWVALEGR